MRAPGIYNTNGIWQIGPMILQWGTEAQQQRWLPGILSADEHWCQGFSEPEAGSDLANMRTTAILDGDHYVVNGQKTWISSAHLAKWGLFLLRTDPTAFSRGAKHEGITAFIIDMETPGIECRPIRDITGDTMLNEVFFTDARIPVDYRLAGEDQGWQVAMSTLGHERVGTAGLSITMAVGPAGHRRLARSGQPRRAATTRRCATASPGCSPRSSSPGSSTTGRSPRSCKGEPNWPEVPLAKLQWSTISQTLAELAVDLLGPAGAARSGAAPTPSTTASGPATTPGSATRRSAPARPRSRRTSSPRRRSSFAKTR